MSVGVGRFTIAGAGRNGRKSKQGSFVFVVVDRSTRKILLMSCVLLLFVRSKIKSDLVRWGVGFWEGENKKKKAGCCLSYL